MDLLNSLLSSITKPRGGNNDDNSNPNEEAEKAVKQVVKVIVKGVGKQAIIYPAVGIGIVLLILLFFNNGSGSAIGGNSSGSDSSTTTTPGGTIKPGVPNIAGFSIKITGPEAIPNSTGGSFDPVLYTVTITYDPTVAKIPLSSIEVYDDPPINGEYIETSGVLKPGSSGRVWPLSEDANKNGFTITLRPTNNDSFISYTVSARSVAGAGIPASSTDCGSAYYKQYMDMTADHLNFGDPNCEVVNAFNTPTARDIMYEQMKSIDPTYAYIWYFCISYNESRWLPVAYLGASTSGQGAYGLFQMNPAGRGNGQYDVGNVYWKDQMQNAVTYNNQVINGSFDYWRGENPNVVGSGSSLACAKPLGPGAN